VTNGTLTINTRAITLTSADDEKHYDGTPLTNDTVTQTGDGFVEGEGIYITVTGRRTNEGEANNTFTYAMDYGTLESNYDITKVYGKLKVTEVEGDLAVYHKLTIIYQYEDGTLIKTFERDYMEEQPYSVTSDKITGYRPDAEVVKGIMGKTDITLTVTYYSTTHTLTVNFVSIVDGEPVADPVSMKLGAGDNYTVFVPALEGYTVLKDKVTGTMPDHDHSIKVFLTPEGANSELTSKLGGNGGDYSPIEIDDFGTPLGVADSILGGGEIIE